MKNKDNKILKEVVKILTQKKLEAEIELGNRYSRDISFIAGLGTAIDLLNGEIDLPEGGSNEN